MSEHQLEVVHRGRQKLDWGLLGRICAQMLRSSECHAHVWVCACGRAHRASVPVCLGEVYACSLAKHTGVGDLLSGCSCEGHHANFCLIRESSLEFP